MLFEVVRFTGVPTRWRLVTSSPFLLAVVFPAVCCSCPPSVLSVLLSSDTGPLLFRLTSLSVKLFTPDCQLKSPDYVQQIPAASWNAQLSSEFGVRPAHPDPTLPSLSTSHGDFNGPIGPINITTSKGVVGYTETKLLFKQMFCLNSISSHYV